MVEDFDREGLSIAIGQVVLDPAGVEAGFVHADQVASYLEMIEEPLSARKIFLAIAHALKPAVVHCTAGKDRTGIFVALVLLANGVPFHDVNADYMLSFPYLTRMSRLTMAKYPDFPKTVLIPDVTFLKEVMDVFSKRYGSVDDYFHTIGISDDDISLLDNLLGQQEKSCGAVVFHEGKILVEHMAKGHYSIPKGHGNGRHQGCLRDRSWLHHRTREGPWIPGAIPSISLH